MHSVAKRSLATVIRLPIRIYSRSPSKKQFSQPRSHFHHSPYSRSSKGGDSKPNGTGTSADSSRDAEVLPEEEKRSQGQNCTALSVPTVKDLTHYGSAAKRSKRSKSNGTAAPSVKVPQWFIDNNVHTPEDIGRSIIGLMRWDNEKSGYVSADERMRSSPRVVSRAESPDGPHDPATSEAAEESHNIPYYVDALQWAELVSTTQGLLKLPTQSAADDVAARKNNLILHYAGDGGVYLLDELIRQLGSELRCNVVSLDALDIADLACEPQNSSMSDDVADDRRLFSYDVYHKEDAQTNEPLREEEQASESDEQEGEDDRGANPRAALSTIFLDMRGTPLELFNNDASRGRKRQDQGQMSQPGSSAASFTSSLFSKANPALENSSAPPQRLLPLIEALSAGPSLKRSTKNMSAEGHPTTGSSSGVTAEGTGLPLILAIRDIKMLQRTSFGYRYLQMLYQHVEDRRRKGQQTIIIGTDTFPKPDVYSVDSIRSLQSEPPTHTSRTMVMTPALPSNEARMSLRKDQKRRTKAINMRHLWQILCIKVPGLYEEDHSRQEWALAMADHPDGAPYFLELAEADRHLWSFDHVHRLATMIVGHLDLDRQASIKECLERACMSFIRSDKTKFAWTEQQQANRTRSRPDLERAENDPLGKLRKKLNRYEKKLISGVIESHKIQTTFEQVHAPLDTIEALKTLTTLSLARPDAFKYGVLANDKIPGLLLYGPPGTGKTLLAKAVAKESGATVLEVSGAELNDMYVGEGEKNVKALFSLAKKLTPCVVFIDEADAVFSARGGGQRRVSHRELLNQFLREWDGMSNDAGSAFIMVATNRPFDLDDAVLRRLPRRLLVDLPSESDRVEILKIHLRDELMAKDVNLANLAARTPFYSGSDLKNLGVAAALNCVRGENEGAKNHSGEVAFEYAERRTLTADHFDTALQEISASISEDMSSLKAIKKFDEQFGDNRGRKKSPKWGFHTSSETEKQLDTVKTAIEIECRVLTPSCPEVFDEPFSKTGGRNKRCSKNFITKRSTTSTRSDVKKLIKLSPGSYLHQSFKKQLINAILPPSQPISSSSSSPPWPTTKPQG